MKSTGIVRRLDELGRVVIPKEIRNKLDIEEKDPIEVYIDGNSIILKKFESGCVFCNNSKDLTSFKDKLVCKKCLQKISNLNSAE
jgi:transcriptional pleiotropic regulator of transition state genes